MVYLLLDKVLKRKYNNTEIVKALATDKTTMTTKRGVKRKAANNHYVWLEYVHSKYITS